MSFVVAALVKRLKRYYVVFLWDKAWRVVSRSVGVIVLFFDYLCGGQGIVSKRFNGAFLQIYFLRFRLRYGVHIFSFREIKKIQRSSQLGRTLFALHPWCHPT